MGNVRDAITLSPMAVAATLAIGGALIAGLVTLVIVLGRKFGEILRQKMQEVAGYGKKLDEFLTSHAEKDGLLVERLTITNERMKNYDASWDTLQARLRDGSQAMQAIREDLAARKDEQERYEREIAARQAKFEQEMHTRELAFANQWQTTLVGLADRFVSKEVLDEYRRRHEQDHGRMEARMAHQEKTVERMQASVLGIDQKLEGGIHTIASLLAKHVTIGADKTVVAADCDPKPGQGV